MNYKIAICDDEQAQREYLQEAVLAWAGTRGLTCELSLFPSGEAFQFACGSPDLFDILLLDIEMKGLSGVDLAKSLRQNGCRGEILFITSHFEFWAEGYEVDALHYLVKPVAPGKLADLLDKAVLRLAEAPPSVVLQIGGETVRLRESDILYAESLLHYISIHTKTQEYKLKGKLSDLAQLLSADFYSPHRSYLISLKQVTQISRSDVILDNRIQIPLSRGKYDEINRAFIERN